MLLTFTASAEFDRELLVHVLAQVQYVLFLWALCLARGTARLCAATATTSAATVAAACATSATPECTSIRHVVGVVERRRGETRSAGRDVQREVPCPMG